MGGGLDVIQILIFAMIAVFLVFRLRSVLGRRTGEERRRPNPFIAPGPEQAPPASDNVVRLPDRGRTDEPEAGAPAESPPLATGLAQIRGADPKFDADAFRHGAEMAFGMIVEAFAKGDTATLRPLVSDDLYDDFSRAIRDRLAAGEVHETRVEQVKQVDLLEARLDGRTAFIAVKFITSQINVTRNAQGEVIDGDPDTPTEITDIWTFARHTKSTNPNWVLVESRTPN